ncbi:MAG: tRNA pseudouridine(55) synthase TruB [Gammaproteobacteria bacterium]
MSRQRRGRAIDGILLLDKPSGISSNSALQQVKRLLNARKAGHTGSLDPLATGLLPVCFGEATKVSAYLLEADKRYEADVRLGATTNTGDSDGEITSTTPADHITQAQVKSALTAFIGEIDQIPPMYSALKKDGERLYKLARKGLEIEREPRRVTIFSLRLLAMSEAHLRIDVRCSKGTYIRTLAEDIGKALRCGAHITALRRTASGPYRIEQAHRLDNSAQSVEELEAALLPIDSALMHFPAVHLAADLANSVAHGNPVQQPGDSGFGMVRMYDAAEQFLGIGEFTDYGHLAPRRIMSGNS